MRDLVLANAPASVAIGGLIIGFILGVVVFRSNFCTMGSVSDMVTFGDYRRFRSWVLAGAVAAIGAYLLQQAGIVELDKSMYLSPTLDWLGNVVGGLLFGFGMVFAGGCASRNLVRLGSGDLRSLFVLIVMGIVAYMTIGGIFGPLRADLSQRTALSLAAWGIGNQSIGLILAKLTGLSAAFASKFSIAVIVLGMLYYCFKDESFRSSSNHVFAGVVIGLCCAAGWAITGMAYDELAAQAVAPVSLTFVRPSGDTLEWLERYTAAKVPNFGVASVLGVLIGAFVASWSAGRFAVTTFADPGDTLRNMFGALLMGVGGVMALGCTVGQGITGISTLALGSFLTFASIVAGGIYGIKKMEQLLMADV